MARRKKLYSRNLLDFRPGIDVVRREGKNAFVVDTEGIYAPVKVDGDHLSDVFKENVARLTPQQAAIMFEVVRTSPFLSEEGRRERLVYLQESGKVRIRFDFVE